MVKVKVLDKALRAKHGEYMHVHRNVVEAGERKGLWIRPLNGSVGVETAEMTAEHGAAGYDTKGVVIPFAPEDKD